jgi:monothiol glutaredoxin
MSEALETIRNTVAGHDVVLFMKGNADRPQCGFSNMVVQILDHLGVDYFDVNVLADEGIRSGVKEFANWPTIPQLYVKGEFVGGCDIVREMFQSG